MQIKIEVTDTFGGESNYAWVRRVNLDVPEGLSDRAIVRRAKAAIGWTGERCTRENMGGGIALWQHDACVVCFINWD